METKQVTLGLIQMSMTADASANLQKALAAIERAAEKGAQIACLPELFTSPYFPQEEKADAAAYADSIPGTVTRALSQAAADNKLVVVGGSIFEKDGNKFYNTSVVFDQKGKLLGRYRKMHIPHDPNFYEQDYFSQGDGYRVFPTSYGKLAVLICYDQWYPEAARISALMGADIIFYPTAIGTVEGVSQEEGDWQDAWTTVQRGHAIANCVAVAAVNRVGREGSMAFWGGSFVSSQFGTLLAKGGAKEELVLAKVDLGLGKTVREGWRFFHNRRPKTYARLLE
jgi:agmatine deiminase